MRRVLAPIGLSGLVACGGIGPGDYAVYRVALGEATVTGDCDPNSDVTTSFLEGDTFIVYAVGADGGDPTFYLDVGDVALEGEETDEGWEFKGKRTETQDIGNGTTLSTTLDETIDLADEGDRVTGTRVAETTSSCAGPDCGVIASFSCTATVRFEGIRVKDEAASVPVE